MGILSWIVFGLIVGVLAKWIFPGRDPGGIIVTIVIGILGAITANVIGGYMGFNIPPGQFSLVGIGSAIGGAILLLFIWRSLIASRL